MLKGIIFDFDGVIAESVKIKTDAFSELYGPFGHDVVQKVILHHEANGGVSRFEKIKYYHKSFLQIDLSEKEIKDLAERFSALVVDKVIGAPYVPGVIEYIRKSYNHYKLFISTGTPIAEMKQILDEKKISHYFTNVFGSPEKKITHIKYILSKYNLDPGELIFYGDSKSDIDAAENEKITFILIKNMFNKAISKSHKGKTINNFIGLS